MRLHGGAFGGGHGRVPSNIEEWDSRLGERAQTGAVSLQCGPQSTVKGADSLGRVVPQAGWARACLLSRITRWPA
jgi:hypothetical protein